MESDLGGKSGKPQEEERRDSNGKSNNDIKFSSSFRLRSPSLNSVRLRRIFDIFDKNKDGLISAEELTQALKLLGLEADAGELESSIRSYIKPGQAGLAFDDFEALHRSLNDVFFGGVDVDLQDQEDQVAARERDESDLSEAFKVFDEDGDGYISARELQTVLEKLGLGEEGGELERVEKMIWCVDTNQDGVVDFFEFKDLMRNIIVPFPSA